MADWNITRLSPQHDRTSFDCGQPSLTDWLRSYASQYEKKGLARTYVATRPGQASVLGYYAITNHHVVYDQLSPDHAKGLPQISVPVVLLGRLAVDQGVQRVGLGSNLLIDALRRTLFLADIIGIRAVEVDAIDDRARRFYLSFGFTPLLDNPAHLLYPLQAVRKLGLEPLAE